MIAPNEAGAPPLIAAELDQRLDFFRALPVDMPEADKDYLFRARFPDETEAADGLLLGTVEQALAPDPAHGFADTALMTGGRVA